MTGKDDCEAMEGEEAGVNPDSPVLCRVIKGFLPLELSPAVDAISRHCRDIHNTTIHLSKTALGCFEYDSATKTWPWLPAEKRPRGWEPVIAAFVAGAAEINAWRMAKHAEAMALYHAALAANPKAKLKEPKLTLVAALGDPKVPPSFAILDLTLSGKVVREWVDPLDKPSPPARAGHRELPLSLRIFAWRRPKEKPEPKPRKGSKNAPCPMLMEQKCPIAFAPAKIHEPRPASARVPSNMARLAWSGARSSLATSIASKIAWLKTPAKARVGGLPSLPGYKPKDRLPAFGVAIAGSRGFPALRPAHDVRTGGDRSLALWAEALRKFNGFGLREHVAKMMESRYAAEIASGKMSPVPKLIRVIPCSSGRPRIQLVVEIPCVHPEGSFLQELAKRHPKEWELRAGDKAMMDAWLLEIMAGQTWSPETMDPKAPYAWASLGYAAAGIDPGTTNIASMGFSSGSKMLVFGGAKVEAEDAKRARRIDRAVSALTLASTIPTLDAKVKAAEAAGLPKPMSAVWEIRRQSRKIHASPRVAALQALRQAGRDDAVERISSKIAQQALAAGVGIVVFSRNHGLKSASGKGREFNRRSYFFPHSRLAQRTREKLWELGIGMAEQEESGTSKASCVDGDRIFAHPRGALQMAEGRRRAAEREAKARAKLARGLAKASLQEPPAVPAAKSMKGTQPQAKPSMQKAFARKQAAANKDANSVQDQQAASTQHKSPQYSGARGAGGERNTFFRTRALTAREQDEGFTSPILREKIHADGQAALNAIRKASPGFKASGPAVRLGHQILLLAGGCWMEWAGPGRSRPSKSLRVDAASARAPRLFEGDFGGAWRPPMRLGSWPATAGMPSHHSHFSLT